MNKEKYDYLIVGSGLFGSTFAHCATQAGNRCLVIDKRPHTGGNVYCENIENIVVHKYGPHIFHTSNIDVWNYVNGLTNFNHFILCPIANYYGELYNLSFNMNTFHQMWGVNTPAEAMAKITSQQYRGVIDNLEQQALSLVGHDIYYRLIKGYTEKQWGRKCFELPPFIIKRLPVRFTYDNNYFNDPYQGIPENGYNSLINKMLMRVDVVTGVDFFNNLHEGWRGLAKNLVYTGKIDDYFNCCFGKLEYRSLHFEVNVLEEANHQGVAVMNYTDAATPYTRVIEHKHFEYFNENLYNNPHTVITKEYPACYDEDSEAYYPVNDERNAALYERYRKLADKEKNVFFGGRLAEYAYYDMDKTIARALLLWGKTSIKIKH